MSQKELNNVIFILEMYVCFYLIGIQWLIVIVINH